MTRDHPLQMLRCGQCGTWWALRPFACKACGATEMQEVLSQGYGTVRARSEIMRAPSDDWRQHTPYVLVLVRLREGPTVMGHADAAIGIDDVVHGVQTRVAHKNLLKFSRTDP